VEIGTIARAFLSPPEWLLPKNYKEDLPRESNLFLNDDFFEAVIRGMPPFSRNRETFPFFGSPHVLLSSPRAGNDVSTPFPASSFSAMSGARRFGSFPRGPVTCGMLSLRK